MENNNKIIALAVTLTVGVILMGGLLMPVIGDYEEFSSVSKSNTGVAVTVIDDKSTDRIVFEYANGSSKINGITVGALYQKPVMTDTFYSSMDEADKLSIFAINGENVALISSITAVAITFENGAYSGTYTTNADPVAINGTYKWCAYLDENGKQVQIGAPYGQSLTVYLTNPGDIRTSGYEASTQRFYSVSDNEVILTGAGNNEVVPLSCKTADVAGTATMKTVNIQADGVNDVSFTVTSSGQPVTVGLPVFILDKTITSYTDLAENTIGLVEALPVILIAALIVIAVGFVIQRRE